MNISWLKTSIETGNKSAFYLQIHLYAALAFGLLATNCAS